MIRSQRQRLILIMLMMKIKDSVGIKYNKYINDYMKFILYRIIEYILLFSSFLVSLQRQYQKLRPHSALILQDMNNTLESFQEDWTHMRIPYTEHEYEICTEYITLFNKMTNQKETIIAALQVRTVLLHSPSISIKKNSLYQNLVSLFMQTWLWFTLSQSCH